MPTADAGVGALLFDLAPGPTRQRSGMLDYILNQEAGAPYLFGVTVRYDGPLPGARVNLGENAGQTESLNRRIYNYANYLVRPEDGWATLWLEVPVQNARGLRWLRLWVRPNRGKVWVKRIVIAKAKTYQTPAVVVALPGGYRWSRVEWAVEPGDCPASVSVSDATTGRELYAGLTFPTCLTDISRIYGTGRLSLRLGCTVPAGTTARLIHAAVCSEPAR